MENRFDVTFGDFKFFIVSKRVTKSNSDRPQVRRRPLSHCGTRSPRAPGLSSRPAGHRWFVCSQRTGCRGARRRGWERRARRARVCGGRPVGVEAAGAGGCERLPGRPRSPGSAEPFAPGPLSRPAPRRLSGRGLRGPAAREAGGGGGGSRPGLMSKSMPFLGASLGSSPSSLEADRLPRVGFRSLRKVRVRTKPKPQPRAGGPAPRTDRTGGGTAGLAAAPVGAPSAASTSSRRPPRAPPESHFSPHPERRPRSPSLSPPARTQAEACPRLPSCLPTRPRFDGIWKGETPSFRRYGRPGRF